MFCINGSTVSNESQIANHFNNFFANIGSLQAEKIPATNPNKFHEYLTNKPTSRFNFTSVDCNEIQNIIKHLKPKNSCGDDNLSLKLLKLISFPVSPALTVIFNQSLQNGIFPESLKLAKVIPLFKKNDPCIFDNYRPISLLPTFSKVIEKIVHKQLYQYFNQNKLIYSLQHGFRESYSTETATLYYVDLILKYLDDDKIPFSIFIDLSKAFDTLNHNILLTKLSFYGVQDSSLSWFHSYLSNRTQYVDYNGNKSEIKNIYTGVPQGSVLGPLLFLIYVNDLCNVSSYFDCLLYADDTTLTSTLCFSNSRNIPINDINFELNKVFTWMCCNKLSLNVSKTSYMVFHSPNKNIDSNIFSGIMINATPLIAVNEFNFLGTIITSSINWKKHCSHICNKLSRIIGILRRLRNTVPSYVLLSIYNSMFVPYLHYSILLWGHCPHRIPKLQKRAIRIVFKTKYNAHTDPIFKQNGLLKFDDMYKLAVLKFFFKNVNNSLPECFVNIIGQPQQERRYELRQHRLPIPMCRKVFTSKCLRYILPKLVNDMPKCISEKLYTHSLSGFSNYIKQYYIKQYKDTCSIPNCFVCNSV
jgi:hypothetical protein